MFAKIDKTGAPIDRGWAWMIVVGFFGCSFFMVGIAKSFGILMDAMKEYFQVDLVQASIVLAVSGGVYTLAAPFGLAFGEIFTQRKVVIFGGIIGGIGVSLSSLLFSIEYMVVMFGLFSGALQKHAKSFTPLIILEACLMVFGGLILLFHPLFIKGLCRQHANKEVEQGEDQLQMPATDSANTMESQS